MNQIKPGNRIGDIGYAIENYAKKYNLGVVKELVGHGVGTSVHEDPDVPNFGRKGEGPLLKKNMVIAIEPMLTFGDYSVYLDDNDWTVKTMDGSKSAHFEHTVLITDDEPIILTGHDQNGKE